MNINCGHNYEKKRKTNQQHGVLYKINLCVKHKNYIQLYLNKILKALMT